MAKPDPGAEGPGGPRDQASTPGQAPTATGAQSHAAAPEAGKLPALPIKLPHHPVVLEEQAKRAAECYMGTSSKISTVNRPLPSDRNGWPSVYALAASRLPASMIE